MSATAVLSPPRRIARRSLRSAGGEQASVALAQLVAGGGNLAFALLGAHVLAPAQYSRLAAFLAAYLLLYMPFSALAAHGSLDPDAVLARRRRVLGAGVLIALLLGVGAAAGLGQAIGLGTPLLIALAVSAPPAGLIALERGRAIGAERRGALIGSLLCEPSVRLLIGLPAALALGAVGAGFAVVAAGYVALRMAVAGGSAAPRRPVSSAAPNHANAVTAAFLLLAVLQNQDVLWANGLLGSSDAARYAVLSTLGGMTAFASSTVPLVLLPRARRDTRGPLVAALAAAAILGLAALLPMALDAHGLIALMFGARYAPVAPVATAYLAAMALLGVGRVLAAHRCAVGSRGPVIALLLAGAVAQAGLIAATGHSVGSVAAVTITVACTLTAGLAVLFMLELRSGRRASTRETRFSVLEATAVDTPTVPAIDAEEPPTLAFTGERTTDPGPRRTPRRWPRPRLRTTTVTLGALMLGGLILRLLAGRSLWLDEATSINQAQMPFSVMLHVLRTTDVHPPMFDSVLWVLNRAFGDSATVMRIPSLLAGTALIGVVYLIGRDLWDRRTGLIAAALITVAPFAVWYSEEARMYALFMLFASLAVWAQARILYGDGTGRRWGWWTLYSVSSAALLWSQYFGVFVILTQQAAFVLTLIAKRERRRELLLPWLLSLAAMAVLVAPLVPFAHTQYTINQASGRGFGNVPSQNGSALEAGHSKPTVYAALTNLAWGIWGYHSSATMEDLSALWPLGILLLLALLGRGRSPRAMLLFAVAALPIAILFAVGQLKPFLFEIRYFCAAVPLLILLMARMCSRWTAGRAWRVGAVGLLLVTFAVALGDQQLSRTNPRMYDFEGALQRLTRQMGPRDVLLYEPNDLTNLISYYAPRLHAQPLGTNPAAADPHGRVFLMASFLNQPNTLYTVEAALNQLRQRRQQVSSFNRPQVRVWAFR